MLIVVMAANVRCRGMKSAARGVRDGRREIATIVRFRSCFSYVAVESGSQFGGGRLLVAGKDRDVVGRYNKCGRRLMREVAGGARAVLAK
jgi:hypothetical protein